MVGMWSSNLAVAAFPVAIADRLLPELAVGVASEGRDEVHHARALEVCEPLAAELDELAGEPRALGALVGLGRGFDDRRHLLAPFVARRADHGDVGDRGVREQHGLHLGWIDVHATRD